MDEHEHEEEISRTPFLSNKPEAEDEEEENSPIEQVALTVPITDDPTIPVLTFRVWVLGTLSCVILSFVNQFFWYRKEPIGVGSISAQIIIVPLGRFMASTITTRRFFPGKRYEFSLNPGPFNVKEHILLSIFASSGVGNVYAVHIVTTVKLFYKKNISFLVSLLVILTTQVLGFGWAGVYRRFLVEPATMWWPFSMVQISLFRVLHEKEIRRKGSLTRMQFFGICFVCSFAYYIFPGYLFRMLSSISWLCWVFPKSVMAQQIGSGMSGLGVGAIALDWSTVTSYLGSPLATPWFATANVACGFIIFTYILTPISYWSNWYNAKTFPIFSQNLFTASGQSYNISGIIDSKFSLDIEAYQRTGPMYMSTFFAMIYGVGFASLTAVFMHVLLFHGREILELTKSAFHRKKMDVHTRLMQAYNPVPESWFLWLLFSNLGVAIFICQYYNDQLQLPWWGVILACAIAMSFALPIGTLVATTNNGIGLNIITEYLIGYVYPGKPVACMLFKTYGTVSLMQSLNFLSDFKIGHYMKIPPRSMFVVQVLGTFIAAFVHLGTALWQMETVPDICDIQNLSPDSPWTCPRDRVFFNASVIWGLVGPRRIFGDLGIYSAINWFFLAGAIAPVLVWIAHKTFPNQHWIPLINMPILISSTVSMPPATTVNFTSWIFVGFLSGFVVYRYRRQWWQRHNYLLSSSLNAGIAFMGLLLYFCLELKDVHLKWWGTNLDGCPLASCPTQKDIVVPGCPVF